MKKYLSPSLQVELFETEDVITVSGIIYNNTRPVKSDGLVSYNVDQLDLD